jgi:hypothetical protein
VGLIGTLPNVYFLLGFGHVVSLRKNMGTEDISQCSEVLPVRYALPLYRSTEVAFIRYIVKMN